MTNPPRGCRKRGLIHHGKKVLQPRHREKGWEGYGVNEMEWGKAARRAGKWSALWWEEAATGPMNGLPDAGFYRDWEPAWRDRTCPWTSGSPLAALGHIGREERQAWLEPGEGCGAAGCKGEQALFPQGRESTKQMLKKTFHPCPQHTPHSSLSNLVACPSPPGEIVPCLVPCRTPPAG